jgi:hypothetical protein
MTKFDGETKETQLEITFSTIVVVSQRILGLLRIKVNNSEHNLITSNP